MNHALQILLRLVERLLLMADVGHTTAAVGLFASGTHVSPDIHFWIGVMALLAALRLLIKLLVWQWERIKRIARWFGALTLRAARWIGTLAKRTWRMVMRRR